jgi:hypothetical protein
VDDCGSAENTSKFPVAGGKAAGCPFESTLTAPQPHPHTSPASRFALSERSPRPARIEDSLAAGA